VIHPGVDLANRRCARCPSDAGKRASTAPGRAHLGADHHKPQRLLRPHRRLGCCSTSTRMTVPSRSAEQVGRPTAAPDQPGRSLSVPDIGDRVVTGIGGRRLADASGQVAGSEHLKRSRVVVDVLPEAAVGWGAGGGFALVDATSSQGLAEAVVAAPDSGSRLKEGIEPAGDVSKRRNRRSILLFEPTPPSAVWSFTCSSPRAARALATTGNGARGRWNAEHRYDAPNDGSSTWLNEFHTAKTSRHQRNAPTLRGYRCPSAV